MVGNAYELSKANENFQEREQEQPFKSYAKLEYRFQGYLPSIQKVTKNEITVQKGK